MILVGNKCDYQERRVKYEEGKELADELEVMFFETSAKSATNINILFEKMAEKIKKRREIDI